MEKYPDALQWGFGDLPALTDALAALVVAGKKTASCGSLAAYQQEDARQLSHHSRRSGAAGVRDSNRGHAAGALL